jgi:Ca2+-binding RTX toxin-like protein
LGANLEKLTLYGTGAVNGTGNSLNNTLTGNSAANELTGGAGNDTYYAGVGDTMVEAVNEGTDLVYSTISWMLGANLENLTLYGSGAVNGTGNSLNNTLTGNSAANVLMGGTGDDTYVVGVGDTVVENANEGVDLVSSSLTYTLGANLEKLTLTGTGAINGTGNSLNNTLTGNSAANVLDGGLGADTLVGGGGNDTYLVDHVSDVVTEQVNGGTDTVQSSVTYTLMANVEHLTLTGIGAINGTGNALDNTLMGNSGNNALNGGAGADVLIGGAGHDSYVVSTGDTVVEQANEGIDTVESDVSWTLGANLEKLTLTGTGAINGTGNGLNNTLVGNSGTNVLTGGLGDDTYYVGTGDTVVEQVNEGVDLVQSDVTWTLGANLERLTLTGTGAINGTGNSLNNTLTGNSAANTLAGGVGNDIYIVSTGDTVVENVGEGTTDKVQSDVTWTLGANIERLTLTGTGAINGTGNSLNNTLTGNSAANVLTGGLGDDTYYAGVGDTMVEAVNEGTDLVYSTISWTLGANLEKLTLYGTEAINGTGNSLSNTLTGNSAANWLRGGDGNDIYFVGIDDIVIEYVNMGIDTVQSDVSWSLGDNLESLTLTGTGAIDGIGNSLNNTLTGNSAANVLEGGLGDDTYLVNRSAGQDTISENDGTAGNSDVLLYGATINPLDLVLSQQANNLRIAIHGSTDAVTIQNWFSAPSTAQVETIQAGNGQRLFDTQVDQLIQAMASFSQQTGLTWDQAIDQQPQQVQTVLAASWQ